MDLNVTDRTLRRYLAGALDPGRREEIEAALAVSPMLRGRLAALVATTVRDEPSAWRVPPVGATTPWSLRPDLSAGAAMGEEAPAAGDYVELRFSAAPEVRSYDVFVLERRTDGDWEVLFPSTSDERLAAARFPREADGRLRLDVVLQPSSTGRFAVALVPPDVGVAWGAADPWADLRAALDQGRVPVEAAALARAG